jgi:hypothetical protein
VRFSWTVGEGVIQAVFRFPSRLKGVFRVSHEGIPKIK